MAQFGRPQVSPPGLVYKAFATVRSRAGLGLAALLLSDAGSCQLAIGPLPVIRQKSYPTLIPAPAL